MAAPASADPSSDAMSEYVKPFAEVAAALIETAGVAIIAGFAAVTIVSAVYLLARGAARDAIYDNTRQILGRGVLLGLEFLVAADIIHTVAVELTWQTVGVLAIVVLIRTFLSFSLELELTGRWPWQQKDDRPALRPALPNGSREGEPLS